jgi:hypothetical protein
MDAIGNIIHLVHLQSLLLSNVNINLICFFGGGDSTWHAVELKEINTCFTLY